MSTDAHVGGEGKECACGCRRVVHGRYKCSVCDKPVLEECCVPREKGGNGRGDRLSCTSCNELNRCYAAVLAILPPRSDVEKGPDEEKERSGSQVLCGQFARKLVVLL